jgi:hypothetical protein
MDTYLAEWPHIVQMCRAAGPPNAMSPRVQRDFLLAIKGLGETWATNQQAAQFRAQINVQSIPTLDYFVAEFGMYWRFRKPVASFFGHICNVGHRPEFRVTSSERRAEQRQE